MAAQGLGGVCDGLIVLAPVAICLAPVDIGLGEVGVQVYGRRGIPYRPIIGADGQEGAGAVAVGQGVAGFQTDITFRNFTSLGLSRRQI